MELTERAEYKVERAVLKDAVDFEGGILEFSDGRGASVKIGDVHKCLFATVADFKEYVEKNGIKGTVCLLGVKEDRIPDIKADACKTFAYTKPLPPAIGDIPIKRLAHTLASFVCENYDRRGRKTPIAEMEDVMNDRGVFGAFENSKLAGFIGVHGDGSMGMLTVFDGYKRRGIGEKLEAFLINYVMTFGRAPFCEVYADNAPALALQKKLGMTEAGGYTFWIDLP